MSQQYSSQRRPRAHAELLPVLVACVLVSVAGAACDDDVTLSNLPGHVTFVGPTQLQDDGVVTWFGVSDPEGNFVKVDYEVCLVEGECYVPELMPGSATIDTLPAVDRQESAPLRLLWRPDCSIHTDDGEFTVRVGALGSDVPPVESPPVTLVDTGFSCN